MTTLSFYTDFQPPLGKIINNFFQNFHTVISSQALINAALGTNLIYQFTKDLIYEFNLRNIIYKSS